MNAVHNGRGNLESTAIAIDLSRDMKSERNVRAKLAVIRATIAVLGIQLLLRALITLRQLNY